MWFCSYLAKKQPHPKLEGLHNAYYRNSTMLHKKKETK